MQALAVFARVDSEAIAFNGFVVASANYGNLCTGFGQYVRVDGANAARAEDEDGW